MPIYEVGGIPYEIEELWDSRSGSRGGGDGDELVILDVYGGESGDPSIDGARGAVLAHAEEEIEFPGLFLTKDRHKPRGGNRWLWELEYSTRPRSTDQIGVEFEVATTMQNRKVSIETIAKYGGTRDFKGAINVSKDNVAGVDVHIPEARFVLKRWFKPSDLTIDFFLTALALDTKVNNATFYGFPAGTLIFLGLGASWIYDVTTPADQQEPVEVPARFGFSRNVTGETIQGITGISRKGWEYPWPWFEDDVDATNKLLIQKPSQINIERTYQEGDFSALGFGTSF